MTLGDDETMAMLRVPTRIMESGTCCKVVVCTYASHLRQASSRT
jgi:hypothetical protein